MPTGEALKPERDPPGVLTGRTGKKEAPWVGLPRLPSFPTGYLYGSSNTLPRLAHGQLLRPQRSVQTGLRDYAALVRASPRRVLQGLLL